MGLTYYEKFLMANSEEELIGMMKQECKVAIFLGANPDRIKAIEEAGNCVNDERGWGVNGTKET